MTHNLSNQVIDDCQVEFDTNRGVLYVHTKLGTILRVCQLPKGRGYPNLIKGGSIDITKPEKVSYQEG